MNIWWEKTVEFLAGRIGQSFVDAWRNNSAVDSDIESLRLALHKGRLLIERSECWRWPKYNPIDELLPQLKDAVYEAESLVDEFVYQGLKNEVEKSLPGINFLKNWMGKFPAEIKEAIDTLDKISNVMKEICDGKGIPENPNKFSETARPKTTQSLETTKTTVVYGRKKEFNEVLSRMGVPISGPRSRSKKLKIGEGSDSTNKKGNVSILSIVGMGGVGKTALAQKVCNNKDVRSYFDPIMWVCVSDNFESDRLTKEIIESATKTGCDLTNPDAMERKLGDILNSKRFLLVLDDVWSKDWQRLLGPMKGAYEGSIVMVTTRSHKWVEVAGTSIDSRGVTNLEGLEENVYWEFFKSCAFVSGANSENYAELEVIGKEICGRLKGSPLAAKTMGGLLRTNMDARHWMNIKESKMWQVKQEEPDILPVLQLSYQYLLSHLKKCVSYCALYPKDFKFTKWELTKLWIMQGFINLPQKLEVHWKKPFISKAEDYFHDLIQRCFLQKAAGSHKDQYVMHDLMHDMCQSIRKDECFCIENEDLEKGIINPNYKYIRHLSVFQKGIKLEEQKKLCKYEKLVSVIVSPWSSYCITAIDNLCKKLTSIRSLSLSGCNIAKLPESIGNLKHLQYLDISFTTTEKLPESFCTLYNLVYLNMEGCSLIKSLPKGLNKLVNLHFVYWPNERLIFIGQTEILAKEIEIEDLGVDVGSHTKIENLKYMNKLSGRLIIQDLENVPNEEAAEEAHLKNKLLVRELNLSWRNRDYTSSGLLVDEHHDEVVFQGLCPHPNLEVLKIEGYGGRTLPCWFKTELWPNLMEIHITSCKRLTNLDCLEPKHFPLLKFIKISCSEKLVSLPAESFGGFQSIEELYIWSCPNFVSFSVEEASNLKSLKKLVVGDCARLQSLLGFKFLACLEQLYISSCPDFVSFSVEEASNLKSLKKLLVGDCARLQSLGGLKFLASLEELGIWNCPKLVETGGEDIHERLPSEFLPGSPSESQSRGPETLKKRSVKRARN